MRFFQLLFVIGVCSIVQFTCFERLHAQVIWEEINIPFDERFYSLAVDKDGDIYLGALSSSGIGGVYQSIDDGVTWKHIGLESQSIYSLNINHNGNLVAGGGHPSDIYLYDKEQEQWESVFSTNQNILVIEPGYDDVIFGASNMILRSEDDGSTWDTMFNIQSTAKDIAVFSKDTVYVGTTDIYGGDFGGVSRSVNGGDTWHHIGLDYHYITSIALTSNGDLYAGGIGHYYYGWGGVYKLPNGSQSWDTLSYWPRVRAMAITEENIIYCGFFTSHEGTGGVMHSEDQGQTWILDTLGMGNVGILRLVLGESEVLYALSSTTKTKLFRSILPVSIKNQKKLSKRLSYCSPNPFRRKAKVYFEKPADIQYGLIVTIYSLNGKIIFTRDLSNDEINKQTFDISRNSLISGFYIYTISGIDYHSIGNFLITH